jgi:hypothetical protein
VTTNVTPAQRELADLVETVIAVLPAPEKRILLQHVDAELGTAIIMALQERHG